MFFHQTSRKLEVNLPIKCNSLKFSHMHPKDLWGLLERRTMLGGGFKDFLFVTPTWGNDPIWLMFFQMAWFNHQPGTMLAHQQNLSILFLHWIHLSVSLCETPGEGISLEITGRWALLATGQAFWRWIDFMAATLWLISGEASMNANSTHIFG